MCAALSRMAGGMMSRRDRREESRGGMWVLAAVLAWIPALLLIAVQAWYTIRCAKYIEPMSEHITGIVVTVAIAIPFPLFAWPVAWLLKPRMPNWGPGPRRLVGGVMVASLLTTLYVLMGCLIGVGRHGGAMWLNFAFVPYFIVLMVTLTPARFIGSRLFEGGGDESAVQPEPVPAVEGTAAERQIARGARARMKARWIATALIATGLFVIVRGWQVYGHLPERLWNLFIYGVPHGVAALIMIVGPVAKLPAGFGLLKKKRWAYRMVVPLLCIDIAAAIQRLFFPCALVYGTVPHLVHQFGEESLVAPCGVGVAAIVLIVLFMEPGVQRYFLSDE